eukprot:jgi/Bigna1/76910/fgenesh1_pg.44_\
MNACNGWEGGTEERGSGGGEAVSTDVHSSHCHQRSSSSSSSSKKKEKKRGGITLHGLLGEYICKKTNKATFDVSRLLSSPSSGIVRRLEEAIQAERERQIGGAGSRLHPDIARSIPAILVGPMFSRWFGYSSNQLNGCNILSTSESIRSAIDTLATRMAILNNPYEVEERVNAFAEKGKGTKITDGQALSLRHLIEGMLSNIRAFQYSIDEGPSSWRSRHSLFAPLPSTMRRNHHRSPPLSQQPQPQQQQQQQQQQQPPPPPPPLFRYDGKFEPPSWLVTDIFLAIGALLDQLQYGKYIKIAKDDDGGGRHGRLSAEGKKKKREVTISQILDDAFLDTKRLRERGGGGEDDIVSRRSANRMMTLNELKSGTQIEGLPLPSVSSSSSRTSYPGLAKLLKLLHISEESYEKIGNRKKVLLSCSIISLATLFHIKLPSNLQSRCKATLGRRDYLLLFLSIAELAQIPLQRVLFLLTDFFAVRDSREEGEGRGGRTRQYRRDRGGGGGGGGGGGSGVDDGHVVSKNFVPLGSDRTYSTLMQLLKPSSSSSSSSLSPSPSSPNHSSQEKPFLAPKRNAPRRKIVIPSDCIGHRLLRRALETREGGGGPAAFMDGLLPIMALTDASRVNTGDCFVVWVRT